MATIKRNLPLNDNYKIIDSYYSSIIDNGGSICANCNKVISNIAVIENANGKKFDVGLDCAETLSNLNGLLSTQMQFAEAKGMRAKINKAKKDGKNIESEILPNGQIILTINGFSAAWLSQNFAIKSLPEIIKMLINPDKIGFTPLDFITIPFENYKGIELKEYLLNKLNTPQTFENFGLKIVCSIGIGLKSDGTPNGSKTLNIDIYKNNELLKSDYTYNVGDLNKKIVWLTNEIFLTEFKNNN